MYVGRNRRSRHRSRRGIALVECSLAYSILFMLIMGTIVTGLGVFRNQQLASLTRCAARWASVHGPTYQSEQGQAAPTSSTVLANAVTPNSVALDSTKLTCSLTWSPNAAAATSVTVQLTYTWVPEGLFSPITFTQTSTTNVTY